jgi:hypothetical protein
MCNRIERRTAMLNKLRIALAAMILALAAVSAVDGAAAGSGGGAGRVSMQDFHFTMIVAPPGP